MSRQHLYLKALADHWKVVVVCAVAGLVLSCIYGIVREPNFSTSTQLYVSAQTGGDPLQAFQAAQLSEQRVQSYTQLVTLPVIAERVSTMTGIALSPEEFAAKVRASSGLESVIITIEAKDSDPIRAAELANATATTFASYVRELERPSAPNGTPSVDVRIAQPAIAPATPSQLSVAWILMLGIVAGAAVGIAAAVSIRVLDNRVRSGGQLAEISGLPILAEIPHDSDLGSLSTPLAGGGPGAESILRLRTNLAYIQVDRARPVLLITSPKPGDGKSTIARLLGASLAATGRKVLLVDADLRRPGLTASFNLPREIGLTSILTGRCDANSAVQPTGYANLSLVAPGPLPPNPSELVSSRQFQDLLRMYSSRFEHVLIDSPPLLPVTDAAAMGPLTDGALLVCRHGSRPSDILVSLDSLKTATADSLGVILNGVSKAGVTGYGEYSEPLDQNNRERGPTPSRRSESQGGGMAETGKTMSKPPSPQPRR